MKHGERGEGSFATRPSCGLPMTDTGTGRHHDTITTITIPPLAISTIISVSIPTITTRNPKP